MTITLTIILLAITVAISYLSFNNKELFERLKHHPYSELNKKEYYRLLTSGFVHGSWLHLGINMFVLWQFGGEVVKEMVGIFGNPLGKIYFLIIYLLTIIFANIPSYLKHKSAPYFSSIGASGAISGILFMYAFFRPWSKIYLYGILGIYAIVAAIAYLIYSSWASKNKNDHIDHSAHFYGAVFGLVLLILVKPELVAGFIHRISVGFPF